MVINPHFSLKADHPHFRSFPESLQIESDWSGNSGGCFQHQGCEALSCDRRFWGAQYSGYLNFICEGNIDYLIH
jgi:hypothetical protein